MLEFARRNGPRPSLASLPRLGPGRSWALGSLLLLAAGLAVAAYLADAPAARAQSDEVVDGADAVEDLHGPGMPDTNPRVAPILHAYPDHLVVICVAGCNGRPRPVQILPYPMEGRRAGLVPSRGVYGPPSPGHRGGDVDYWESNDVVCMAGCRGRPGQVLQRMPDLPPPAK